MSWRPLVGDSTEKPLVVAALLLLVAGIYWPVGSHSFIVMDDPMYVYENRVIREGLSADGVVWAFTAFHAGNWHPITWLSHMLDVELFGLSPGPHHLMNVLFHAMNTVLLFLLLDGMTRASWRSAFVAALFAVHPLHVESVAWVAQRKDVLSTFFMLLALHSYRRYVQSPGSRKYLPVALFFALGLMSKPVLVTFPVLLLLLDVWPLDRISRERVVRLLAEKAPLVLMSVAVCVVTFMSQSEDGAMVSLVRLPFTDRVVNMFCSYSAYLWNTAWPASLSVYYPNLALIGVKTPWWKLLLSLSVVASTSFFAVRAIPAKPFFAVGWFWYLVALLPMSGLIQVGNQAMADRYTYIPMIGVFVMAAWAVPELSGMRLARIASRGALVAILVALALVSRAQAEQWKDSVTLFSQATRNTDRNWFAWNNLGNAYAKLGDYGRAVESYKKALRANPRWSPAARNLGWDPRHVKSNLEIEENEKILRANPSDAVAWCDLGIALGTIGRTTDAVKALEKSVEIRPDYVDAWYNLAIAYSSTGRLGDMQTARATLSRLNASVATTLDGVLPAGERR